MEVDHSKALPPYRGLGDRVSAFFESARDASLCHPIQALSAVVIGGRTIGASDAVRVVDVANGVSPHSVSTCILVHLERLFDGAYSPSFPDL